MTRRRLALLYVVAALIAAALLPLAALADGDPASDVLIGQNVYSPYQPRVAPKLFKALDGLTKEAKKAGFPIKVALVASPNDLGVVPNLFGKPQQYAQYLGPEIQFNGAQPVLVVMPAGFGTFKVAAKATKALDAVKVRGSSPDDLARAGVAAVGGMSAALGHRLPVPDVSATGGSGSKGSSGGGGSALVFAAPIAVLALLGLFLATRRATAAAEPASDSGGEGPPVESGGDAGT